MNMTKCERGHFYDAERYQSCPHCAAPAQRNDNLTVPMQRAPANDAVTVAMDVAEPAPSAAQALPGASLQDAVAAASTGALNAPAADDQKTVGYFSSAIGTEPVVGWLVCAAGPHFGEDFKLKSGRNFIGRAPGMDVAIAKDGTVSRERHAVVIYEPRGNMFIVQPGDSKELSYLNDEVVLAPKELKMHDRLTLGKTELMFIPCCTDQFNWAMVSDN
jgi:hypothetical protein